MDDFIGIVQSGCALQIQAYVFAAASAVRPVKGSEKFEIANIVPAKFRRIINFKAVARSLGNTDEKAPVWTRHQAIGILTVDRGIRRRGQNLISIKGSLFAEKIEIQIDSKLRNGGIFCTRLNDEPFLQRKRNAVTVPILVRSR